MAMHFTGKAKLFIGGQEVEATNLQVTSAAHDATIEVTEHIPILTKTIEIDLDRFIDCAWGSPFWQAKADALGDRCCRELGEIERRKG